MDYVKDLVSVIIPTYRRSDMLIRAIESVLNQTYKNIELIVVNDNIKGDEFSLELYKKIENIKDERLKFIEQEEHINGAAARNAGIKEAKGEYISFLDDDDYWKKEKIEHQLNLLKTLDKSYGGVSCLVVQEKNGEIISAKLPYSTKNLMVRVLSRRTRIGTGAVLLRRKALDETGYFDVNLKRHQEIQLFAFFASKYKMKLLNEYLYFVDISDGRNRPSIDKLKNIKNDFYKSIAPLFDDLNKKQKTQVHLMHQAEICVAFLKRRYYLKFLKNSMVFIKHPIIIIYLINLGIERFVSHNFKKILMLIYNI
ncbi:MAG: glycosyltransferase family 2 protein [Ruminococcaceae bacterium]|nr:glycosyltransferase family 2 protein [Oscillospiraceae bacterium]